MQPSIIPAPWKQIVNEDYLDTDILEYINK